MKELVCRECKRQIEQGEIAYRMREFTPPDSKLKRMGWHGWQTRIYYACEACAKPKIPKWRMHRLRIYECPGCNIKIGWLNKRPYSWTRIGNYCSWRCRRKHEARKAREALHCLECGEPLTASRTDAQYCSGKCRQKAYRARKNLSWSAP